MGFTDRLTYVPLSLSTAVGGAAVAAMSAVSGQLQPSQERHINFSERNTCAPLRAANLSPLSVAGNISTVKVELPSPSPSASQTGSPSPPASQPPSTQPPSSTTTSTPLASHTITPSALLSQMNALGPTDRCTPSQAQAMGQQVLAVIALHEKNTLQLPREYIAYTRTHIHMLTHSLTH